VLLYTARFDTLSAVDQLVYHFEVPSLAQERLGLLFIGLLRGCGRRDKKQALNNAFGERRASGGNRKNDDDANHLFYVALESSLLFQVRLQERFNLREPYRHSGLPVAVDVLPYLFHALVCFVAHFFFYRALLIATQSIHAGLGFLLRVAVLFERVPHDVLHALRRLLGVVRAKRRKQRLGEPVNEAAAAGRLQRGGRLYVVRCRGGVARLATLRFRPDVLVDNHDPGKVARVRHVVVCVCRGCAEPAAQFRVAAKNDPDLRRIAPSRLFGNRVAPGEHGAKRGKRGDGENFLHSEGSFVWFVVTVTSPPVTSRTAQLLIAAVETNAAERMAMMMTCWVSIVFTPRSNPGAVDNVEIK